MCIRYLSNNRRVFHIGIGAFHETERQTDILCPIIGSRALHKERCVRGGEANAGVFMVGYQQYIVSVITSDARHYKKKQKTFQPLQENGIELHENKNKNKKISQAASGRFTFERR